MALKANNLLGSFNFTIDGRFLHAFNGTGMGQAGAWGNFKINGLLLYGGLANGNYNVQQQQANGGCLGNPDAVGMDEDYDACDLDNWFLAIQSADGQVIVPSFHRPGIIRVDTSLMPQVENQTNPASYQTLAAGNLVNDWQSTAADSAARFLRPRNIDGHSKLSFPDLYPDPTSGKITYDVDNDGDGVTDSVWLDLGYPAIRDSEGQLYKPLFAFLVIGLNGRMPLNTAGNLQAPRHQRQPARPARLAPGRLAQRDRPDLRAPGPDAGRADQPDGLHDAVHPDQLQYRPALLHADGLRLQRQHHGHEWRPGQRHAGPQPAGGHGPAGLHPDEQPPVDVGLRQFRFELRPVRNRPVRQPAIPLPAQQHRGPRRPELHPAQLHGVPDDARAGLPAGHPGRRAVGRGPGDADERLLPRGRVLQQPDPRGPVGHGLHAHGPVGPAPTIPFIGDVSNSFGGSYGLPSYANIGGNLYQYFYRDADDDNFNTFDFYLGEGGDYRDAAGGWSLPVERYRRFTTPFDAAGDGTVINYADNPSTQNTMPTSADAYGRVTYFKYFRPPGLPSYAPNTSSNGSKAWPGGITGSPTAWTTPTGTTVTSGGPADPRRDDQPAARLRRGPHAGLRAPSSPNWLLTGGMPFTLNTTGGTSWTSTTPPTAPPTFNIFVNGVAPVAAPR